MEYDMNMEEDIEQLLQMGPAINMEEYIEDLWQVESLAEIQASAKIQASAEIQAPAEIETPAREGKAIEKRCQVKLLDEPLTLQCKWDTCEIECNSWEAFDVHLMNHATVDSGDSKCSWTDCEHHAISTEALKYHLSLHGYYSKLINIGQNSVERNGLPECHQKKALKMPNNMSGYSCEWNYCSSTFVTIFQFLSHLVAHVKVGTSIGSKNEKVPCFWRGCTAKFATRTKLTDHLRTHSEEKVIGCPTCLATFANRTKFADHRKRQQPSVASSHHCLECDKLFASGRLLRDHVRTHTNGFKCTMCVMSFPKSSHLVTHIRFKHLDAKPYECPSCDKCFVTKSNLDAHMMIHNKENPMKCDTCDFSCRTKIGLNSHRAKEHGAASSCYMCHCCNMQFKQGSCLTRHLVKEHNYFLAPGHTRFKYRQDRDGFHRLQTIRYETQAAAQQVNEPPPRCDDDNNQYLVEYNVGGDGMSIHISKNVGGSVPEDGPHDSSECSTAGVATSSSAMSK